MEDNSKNNPLEILKKLARENYKWFIGALSITLCFTTLWIYTRYIGRPDVFSASIEITPQTILMSIAAILSFLGFLILLFLPSLLLVQGRMGLNMNNQNRKHIARWLFVIAVTNTLCLFISIVSLDSWKPAWTGSWLIPGLISSFIMTLIFIKLHKDVAMGQVFSVFVVSISLFLSATMSTPLLLLISDTYTDIFSLVILYIQWTGITLLSFTPAISYLNAEKDNILTKTKRVSTSVVLITTLIITFTPSLLGNFSLKAIRIARLIDNHPRYYQILQSETDSLNLNKEKWNIDNISNNSYRVIATNLYSFGSKILLCPKELANISPAEIHIYTHQCILFKKSSITPLNRVI